MSITTSTGPAQPERTVEELQEALDQARAEYEDLVEVHDDHMEAYEDAHQAVHAINTEILSLEEEGLLMQPIVLEWTRRENRVIKEEHGQDMVNAREAVKEVRTQLREIKERVRCL